MSSHSQVLDLIPKLEEIAWQAGQAILKIYQKGSVEFRSKDDASPVTEADLLANEIICQGLNRISTLPIISEEGWGTPALDQSSIRSFWLVDPLDGTKEFIARRPTFTVNIALIENGQPTAGVVYAPDRDELFAGAGSCFRINRQLFVPKWSEPRVVVSSASHAEPQLLEFLNQNNLHSVLKIGSSYKFCLVAKGEAHFYPRFRQLSAWDIAAGHAVARAAGCQMDEIATGQPVRYEFERRWCPGFLLKAPGLLADVSPGSEAL